MKIRKDIDTDKDPVIATFSLIFLESEISEVIVFLEDVLEQQIE